MSTERSTGDRRVTVHPVVDRLAAYGWRLLVIAAALAGVVWVVGRVWVAFVPLLVGVFLTRILVSPVAWLRGHRWHHGLAAAVTLVGFLVVLVGTVTLVGVAVASEFADLGPTVSQALNDLERWLVEDSPFNIDQSDLDRFRREAGEAVGDALRGSGAALASGATVVAEVVFGFVLGLIVTFFSLKDGDRFVDWALGLFPEDRRELVRRMAARSWETLAGYLRGAALLGLVEGAAIGIALTVVGAELALPMALVTFLAAFVPVVGAIVAGVLAVLVALATAGATAGFILAVVALVVQQLDNDLLAPVVYGRALALHPVVVLITIVAGGSAFGLVGTFLAVPVVAVVINAVAEARAYRSESRPDQRTDGPTVPPSQN